MKNNLLKLEEEAISIIRETYSSSSNPTVLYSIGKDSSVLLHLFKKAFYPVKIPVPFLHIDTGWKFKEMIKFRDKVFSEYGINGIVYQNQTGISEGVNPFDNPNYTDVMKTEALKKALTEHNFDFVYGGARRDEEASRSKEKIVSYRDKFHRWDPKNQRIEPWLIFNTKKLKEDSFRVFPISNWTEVNIWEYIEQEEIEIVPLYFSKKRKVVVNSNGIFLLDDDRFKVSKKDQIENLNIRFRTLGCYPLTSGTISNAKTIKDIILELSNSKYSERSGRLIDKDVDGSMELKKQEGYF